MSTPLRTIVDKENIHGDETAGVKASDLTKLERLYAEQLARSQEAQHEQERLELEVLQKEKQLLQHQTDLQRANETNRRLVEKFEADAEFLEQEVTHYKSREAELNKQLHKQKSEIERLKLVIREKEDEMSSLNEELEEVLLELEARTSEEEKQQSDDHPSSADHNDVASFETAKSRSTVSDSEDDDAFDGSDILPDESFGELDDADEDDDNAREVGMDSMSLTDELSMKIEQKDTQLKKLRFEINALKNEKSQLYGYVNKLLRNKPSPDQNNILKEKLVRRRILRAVSINAANDTLNKTKSGPSAVNRHRSKRVTSNFVNLKSYSYKARPSTKSYDLQRNTVNSDAEDDVMDEEGLELERLMLGYRAIGSGLLKPLMALTPLHQILRSAEQTDEKVDLDVD